MLSNSIAGIRYSLTIMDKAAVEAARGSKGDIMKSQIGMIIASNSLSANIVVHKTANELQKTIIDILA